MKKTSEKILLEDAQKKLSRIWFIGSGLLFSIVVLFSIIGTYDLPGDQGNLISDVFSWLMPLLLPTLTLIIGVLGATAMGNKNNQSVKKSFYSLTYKLSAVYLIFILLTLLGVPFSKIENPVNFYSTSNFWLTPLQGLAIAAMGYLFSTGEDKD